MRKVLYVVVLLWASACGSGNSGGALDRSGPRLVSEVTLAPTTPAPTRIITETPIPSGFPTTPPPTQLVVPSIESDVVLVTPTLPPSKTPTLTPTFTDTPTLTRTPTITPSATATLPPFVPAVGQPSPVVVNNVSPNSCTYTWFFVSPQPPACPVGWAMVSNGSLLYFENGFMIWVELHDAIYVFFNDANQPRWQVFNDGFEATMPETDPAFDANIPPLSWQPRRGFGLVWREQTLVRDRIGWSIQEGETAYNVAIQASTDGVIFMSQPNGTVISLSPNGTSWQGY